MNAQKIVFFSVFTAASLLNVFAGDLTLCKDGKTEYTIHYSKTASATDRFAVQELQTHLTAMT